MFTDESYFETGALRRRRARGVLRRAGEAFLPRNLNRKFPKGATVMFWGAILHGHKGKLIILFIATSTRVKGKILGQARCGEIT